MNKYFQDQEQYTDEHQYDKDEYDEDEYDEEHDNLPFKPSKEEMHKDLYIRQQEQLKQEKTEHS